MRKLFTFLFAALMSVGMWADPIVVEWNSSNLPSSGNANPFTKDGVTITCDGIMWIIKYVYSPGTFTTDLGYFTQIEITADDCDMGNDDGWNGSTWTGNAASVSFDWDIDGLTKIVFTIGDEAPTNPSGSCGANLSWEFDPSNGTLTITGTGAMYDYDNDENRAPWFSSRQSITSVIIPDGVTRIGNYAFAQCTGLTSIEIPNSVTSIGEGAFAYSGLTSVTIGNSVESIGESAFDHCTALTSIEIPNSVESIGETAFYGCYGVTSVTIGNSVTSIGMGAFYGCGMSSIEIPSSVTSIETSVFAFCTGLTSITIPNSVESIGWYAFRNCSNLTSVTIGNSVTSIVSGAFADCSNITSVIWNAKNCSSSGSFGSQVETFVFGNEVESIPASCCSGMNKLSSISIPCSVTSIGADAFYDCTSITDVYCYPDAADLTWAEGDCNDFKADGSTVCHVFASELTAYQSEFTGTVNVTFDGDLTGSCGGSTPTGFDITANLDPQNAGVYYSTFYHGSVDYALPANVKAYKAVISGSNLHLSEVAAEGDVLPKGNAVILRSSVQNYTLTPSDATPVSVGDDNDLEGSDDAIATPANNCYVLSCENSLVGFYQYGAANLNPHKAYVIYEAPNPQNPAPRRMPFIFDQATGVENVQGNVQSTKVLRDGQLIIIRNGVEYNANGMMVK